MAVAENAELGPPMPSGPCHVPATFQKKKREWFGPCAATLTLPLVGEMACDTAAPPGLTMIAWLWNVAHALSNADML